MIYSFINYLRINRGLSENTCKAYQEALHDFAKYINSEHRGTTWSTVTKAHVDEYVVRMVADGAAAATIKQHVSALRTFYKTCKAMGQDVQNPARYVSTPKLGEQLPKVIEREAIRDALASQTVSRQAKAAIAIIYETGIRLQELLDLKASDIDRDTNSIKIEGKGRKERTVYYGELTKQYGGCWRGSQHTQREVRTMVYEALKPFSKAEQLSPHALRHTYASTLLNNGMPMPVIQKLLGHKHVQTTEIYAKLAYNTVIQDYTKYQPRL